MRVEEGVTVEGGGGCGGVGGGCGRAEAGEERRRGSKECIGDEGVDGGEGREGVWIEGE